MIITSKNKKKFKNKNKKIFNIDISQDKPIEDIIEELRELRNDYENRIVTEENPMEKVNKSRIILYMNRFLNKIDDII